MFNTDRSRWLTACLSLSCLLSSGLPAIAALPSETYADITFEMALEPDVCTHRVTEQSAISVEFDQATLAAAQQVANALSDPAERADALMRIGSNYACLGEVQQAAAILEKAKDAALAIDESVIDQGQLLVQLARTIQIYVKDTQQMNRVLAKAIALAQAALEEAPIDTPAPEETANQETANQSLAIANNSHYNFVVSAAAYAYAEVGEYEQLKALLDQQEEKRRNDLMYGILPTLRESMAEADRDRVTQLFPNWENPEHFLLTDDDYADINSPLMSYLLSNDYLFANEETDINATITKNTQEIEALPDAFSQAVGYISLGTRLLDVAPERAVPLLEQAAIAFSNPEDPAQAPALIDQPAWVTDFFAVQWRLGGGTALMRAGEIDQGREMILAATQTPGMAAEYAEGLLYAAANLADRLPSTELTFLLTEAERRLPDIEAGNTRNQTQLEIAIEYLRQNNTDAARRLTWPLAQAMDTDEAIDDSFILFLLSKALVELGEYDQAIAAAERSEDPNELAVLTGGLVRQQQDELALETLDKLDSSYYRSQAVTLMMSAYQEQGNDDMTLALAQQMLTEIDRHDYQADTYYSELIEQFRQDKNYHESEIEHLIHSFRYGAALGTLIPFLQPSEMTEPEVNQLRSLINILSEPNVRLSLTLSYLPAKEALDAAMPGTELIESGQLDDRLLHRLMAAAVSEGRNEQAVKLLEAVRSPYARALGLTYLANEIDIEQIDAELLTTLEATKP